MWKYQEDTILIQINTEAQRKETTKSIKHQLFLSLLPSLLFITLSLPPHPSIDLPFLFSRAPSLVHELFFIEWFMLLYFGIMILTNCQKFSRKRLIINTKWVLFITKSFHKSKTKPQLGQKKTGFMKIRKTVHSSLQCKEGLY